MRAKNANGNSPWQTSDALNSPTLATGGIYVNTVNLNIFNYYGSWYYQADVGPHSTCTGPAPNIHPTLTGLADGGTYTYTAYDHATCDGDALTPPVTFTTLPPVQWLSVSNVADTTATLNIHDQYPYDKWWYARLGVPNSFNCVEVSGSSANLTGLSANTLYDYAAYTNPFCYKAHILDRTYFSTTDAGTGNLTSGVDDGCAFGKPVGATLQSCAVTFTTGTNAAGGFFLDAVTVRLGYEIGWTNGLSVALHSADAAGKPAAQALATMTATPPKWGGYYTFSCSGSGACDLANDTKYFIVLSAPKSLYSYYRHWQTRNSALEYRWPPSSGWAIGNGGMARTGGGDWTALGSGQTPCSTSPPKKSAPACAPSRSPPAARPCKSADTPPPGTSRAMSAPTAVPAPASQPTPTGAPPPACRRGTYHIYTAYSDSACTAPIASVAFTTVATSLAASDVRDDTATLTLAGHSGNWHYQANTAPHTSCSTAQTGSSVNLSGLSPITSYTYSAYSDSNCANLIATAGAFTTGGVAVSNLGQSADTHSCNLGNASGSNKNCAVEFSTGDSAAGYTLRSATAKFASKAGSPSNFSVQIYDKSGGGPGSAVSNATFSGGTPDTIGEYSYACSDAGCALNPNTDYFLVMSATATNTGFYSWRLTNSSAETQTPNGNGWSIGDVNWIYVVSTSDWSSDSGKSPYLKLAATVNMGLGVSNKKATTATLGIGGYSGQWWYDADKSPYTSCHSAGSASSVDLDHLTAGTEYTFTAYKASGCDIADEIASETFTTVEVTTSVTATSATITVTNHGGSWYYKEFVPSASCSSEQTGTSVTLTGLTPGTHYSYIVTSDSGCTNSLTAISISFTTGGVSVSNLGISSISACTVGVLTEDRYQCANAFTTGSAANGYKLNSVTAEFLGGAGSPTGFTVGLHAESNGKPAATALATLSGNDPSTSTGSTRTYACSGSGCSLLKDTDYFVVMMATNASGSYFHRWRKVVSNVESKVPDTNGWSIADGLREGTNWDGTESSSTVMKVAATVNPILTATVDSNSLVSLTLTNGPSDWWFKIDGGCTAVSDNRYPASGGMQGYTGGPHTVRAYSDSSCSAEIATTTFTVTASLTASAISGTGATLTVGGHSGAWSYQGISGTEASSSCADVSAGTTTATLSSLTADKLHGVQRRQLHDGDCYRVLLHYRLRRGELGGGSG